MKNIKAQIFASHLNQNIFISFNENKKAEKGQLIGLVKHYEDYWVQYKTIVKNVRMDVEAKLSDCLLYVKHLSKISDEDAIEVGKILFGKQYSVGRVDRRNDYEVSVQVLIPDTTTNHNVRIGFNGSLHNCNGYNLQNTLQAHQYLQSKGYALPYMEYSIDELVEQGIYEIEK